MKRIESLLLPNTVLILVAIGLFGVGSTCDRSLGQVSPAVPGPLLCTACGASFVR